MYNDDEYPNKVVGIGDSSLWTEPFIEDEGEVEGAELQQTFFDITLRALRAHRHRPLPVRRVVLSRKRANEFIERVHRHSRPVQGWKYCVALEDDISLVGLAIVGRPVARALDNGQTLEVTRVCVLDGKTKNIVSQLLGGCIRIAVEGGYRKLVTYTREEEDGSSLRSVGFVRETTTSGGSWNSKKRRRKRRPSEEGKKVRWARVLQREEES